MAEMALVKALLLDFLPKARIYMDESMAKHSSFRAGGDAAFYVEISSADELVRIIPILIAEKVPYVVLGNGTNVLFRDEGYAGVVMKLTGDFENISVDYDKISVGAAVPLSKAARVCEENSLTGFEFAAGIPGTAGGAMVMNAGAYGSEMKDIVYEVKCISFENDKPESLSLSNKDMDFGYRESVIKKRSYIVTAVTFKLAQGDKDSIRFNMENLAKKRRDKQPLEFPSAGSTFKRPDGFFAGALIEQAGLKGYSVGDAEVSEKHAGFVINKGNATAGDIIAVIEHVREKVFEMSGVRLETEVHIL